MLAMAPLTIGKYRVDRLIKRGGMGAVYLALDPELNRRAAIKVLRDDLEGDDNRERFRREAMAIAALDHPNIVRIFHAGVDDDRPYIAMEYVNGESLADLIKRNAALPLERKLQIVEDVCSALGAAHDVHIVHRDIKPANVLVAEDGTVKVVDFGIARTPDTTLTQLGMLVGTVDYMAPEQFGDRAVDGRADIFAVGVLLYELIAQRRPFPGEFQATLAARVRQRRPISLAAVCSEIDRGIAAIVAKALEHDPRRRYQNVRDLRDALAAARRRASAMDQATLVSPRGHSALLTGRPNRGRARAWRGLAVGSATSLVLAAAAWASIERGAFAPQELPAVRPAGRFPFADGLPRVVPGDVPQPPPVLVAAPPAPSIEKPVSMAVAPPKIVTAPRSEPPTPKPAASVEVVTLPSEPPQPAADAPGPTVAVAQPAPSTAPPVLPPTTTDHQLVREVVDRYLRAMIDRNVAAMADLRTLDLTTRAQMEEQFSKLRSWKVTLADSFVTVTFDGSSARVTGRMKYEDVRLLDGRGGNAKDQNVTIELRKIAGVWRITQID